MTSQRSPGAAARDAYEAGVSAGRAAKAAGEPRCTLPPELEERHHASYRHGWEGGFSADRIAALNRQHVREQVEQRDPALARALEGLLREREPRQERATRGSR